MDILFWMRLICLFIWAGAALCLIPSFMRVIKGPHTEGDEWRTAFFFTGLLLVGSFGGRILGGDDLNFLLPLNAITAALGVYILILILQGRPKK